MSHFSVLIIGDDPEGQLAMFDESIKVAKYVARMVTEVDKNEMLQFYSEKGFSFSSFEKCYEKFGLIWNGGNWRKNNNGVWEEWTDYNPASKWDWYEIGGRWAGTLKLKDGVKLIQPINFSWGWEEKDRQRIINDNRADVAYKRDIINIDEIVCFAMIKDGIWCEEGQSEPWIAESKSGDVWENQFKELIRSVSDDTLISVYDCHY